MQGRRREDTPLGSQPADLQAGDYWKVTDDDGQPLSSEEDGNLTGTVWMVAPTELGYAWMLTKHTVREHEDGTCSIRPGDGSSNSVLIKSGTQQLFHGYLEHGEWSDA